MKKSLLVLLCVLGFGVAGLASAQSSSFSSIQRLLNTLEGQMAALKSEQSAQVGSSVTAKKITTVKNSDSAVSITSSDDPIQGSPDPVPGGVVSCPGGATMPAGSRWQTIYCNGVRWVANSAIQTNGTNVGIRSAPSNGTTVVIDGRNSSTEVGAALSVYQPVGGTAISAGNNAHGVGVLATGDQAVIASVVGDGWGFTQWGANGRNEFQGSLQVNSLAGNGSAYVCVNGQGRLFRSITPCTSATGAPLYVSNISAQAGPGHIGTNGIYDYFPVTFQFTLNNDGNSNVFVSKVIGTSIAYSGIGGILNLSAMLTNPAEDAADTSTAFSIAPGTSRRFTYTGILSNPNPTQHSQQSGEGRISAINYGSSANDNHSSSITQGLETLRVYVNF